MQRKVYGSFPCSSIEEDSKSVEPSYYRMMKNMLQARSLNAFYENSLTIIGIIKRMPRSTSDWLRIKLMNLPEVETTVKV
jgi:hypothetical protein